MYHVFWQSFLLMNKAVWGCPAKSRGGCHENQGALPPHPLTPTIFHHPTPWPHHPWPLPVPWPPQSLTSPPPWPPPPHHLIPIQPHPLDPTPWPHHPYPLTPMYPTLLPPHPHHHPYLITHQSLDLQHPIPLTPPPLDPTTPSLDPHVPCSLIPLPHPLTPTTLAPLNPPLPTLALLLLWSHHPYLLDPHLPLPPWTHHSLP